MFHFTFENLKKEYESILSQGYKIMTCEDYFQNKNNLDSKVLINRIDIDYSVIKAEILGKMFKDLGINGTFFVRLHAPEYNVFSFENYRIIRQLISEGNEIGYHSEVIDQSKIWSESPETNLFRDVKVLNKIFGIEIKGTASHGGMTGYNNLDFWKDKNPKDFNLEYEAYDWFDDVFYISDSEWTRWKCYNKGKLVNGDNNPPSFHIKKDYNLINLLIHSDTYFFNNFYETSLYGSKD